MAQNTFRIFCLAFVGSNYLIHVNGLLTGNNFTCDTFAKCQDEIIQCDGGSNCNVQCGLTANEGCERATIHCADNYECNIMCGGLRACSQITIYGNSASLLNVSSYGYGNDLLRTSKMYCPDGGDCQVLCNSAFRGCESANITALHSTSLHLICTTTADECDAVEVYCPIAISLSNNCILEGVPDTTKMNNMRVYSVNGFSSLSIINQVTSIGTIYCKSNFVSSCIIDQNMNMCDPPNTVCNDVITTSSPITSIPTSIQTTSSPITVIPTTSIPSTSIPTQNPITSIPTTAIPITSIPSTSIPSTAIPITSIPTTSIPTQNPLTSTPITVIPTTVIPTSLVPTQNPLTSIPTHTVLTPISSTIASSSRNTIVNSKTSSVVSVVNTNQQSAEETDLILPTQTIINVEANGNGQVDAMWITIGIGVVICIIICCIICWVLICIKKRKIDKIQINDMTRVASDSAADLKSTEMMKNFHNATTPNLCAMNAQMNAKMGEFNLHSIVNQTPRIPDNINEDIHPTPMGNNPINTQNVDTQITHGGEDQDLSRDNSENDDMYIQTNIITPQGENVTMR